MQTLTRKHPISTEQGNYIHDFREIFAVDEQIDDDIIARQKEAFGFSLFLLHSKSIFEALRIGFLNSRNVFERTKGILSIPHTSIFGGLFLGLILKEIGSTYLFLPIFFTIVLLSLVPAFRIIHHQMELYKKSRIFFNVDVETGKMIKREFFELAPFKHKPMMWKSSEGGEMDGNSFGGKMVMFLFSQPFIFGLLDSFVGFSFPALFIFDIAIFFIIFGIFERMIFVAFALFYAFYFFLLDHVPYLFSREDQERDFYMDLYKRGNELLAYLLLLELNMTDAKNGTINSTLGRNLTTTIIKIYGLYELIEKKSFLLEGKTTFQKFLIGMLNEIMTIYAYVFDFLKERIFAIESGINTENMNEVQRTYMLQVIKPILDKRRGELEQMKDKILQSKILL